MKKNQQGRVINLFCRDKYFILRSRIAAVGILASTVVGFAVEFLYFKGVYLRGMQIQRTLRARERSGKTKKKGQS